jgi:hypothetical protein
MPPASSATVDLLKALDAKPIDLYDAWLAAETEAGLALADWMQAPDDDKATAYARYAAALDREEKAAQVLALGVAGEPVAVSWR